MDLETEQRNFHEAIARIVTGNPAESGIGTLGEKTLHAVCKLYMEPDPRYHEIPTGSFVADIAREGLITEIQTRSFDRLRGKLKYYFEQGYVVNVVCPIPALKWLCWMDPDAGTVTDRRKSPKRGTVYDMILELYKIKPLIGHPNLDLTLLLLEVQEYRTLNGWSRDRKKGSTRYERIPISLIDRVTTGVSDGFSAFIPEGLPEEFTSADFAKAARIPKGQASTLLGILHAAGTAERIGKSRNAYIYRLISKK